MYIYKKNQINNLKQEIHGQAINERKFMSEVLATVGSLIVVLDRDGSILKFNKACEELTGYSFNEVVGRKVWDFLLLVDEVEPVINVFNQLTAGDFPNKHENYWLTKAHEPRLIHWSNTALTNDSGEITHIIATGVDITEQRSTQNELRKAYDELEVRIADRTKQLAQINKKLQEEIEERTSYQIALKRSEKALKDLYEITAVVAQPFEERVQNLLKLGCKHFDLPIGIFSRIKGSEYKVVSSVSPGGQVSAGMTFDLGVTYCNTVLQTNDPIGFEHASETEWQTHPAYQEFQLEAYLGSRVNLGDTTYGTLNFSSPTPRAEAFSESDKELLKLMTNWLGEELLRQRVEQKFRALLESAPDGILVFNQENKIILVNAQVEKLFGYKRDELINQNLNLILPESVDKLYGKNENINVSRQINQYLGESKELIGKHKFGQKIPLEISLSPFETDEGILISGVVRDVTARKLAESELRRAATVFENTNEGIIITDKDQTVLAVNQAFTKITGYASYEILGKKPSMLRCKVISKEFNAEQLAALETQGQWRGEVRNRRKDGESYPVLENVSVVKDNQDNVVNYITVFSDISVIKKSEERLNYLAHHDALTNLPNRLLFGANLDRAIEHAKRYKQKVALLFLDLDRFKIINDTLGHSYGDVLLQTTGSRIVECVRREDTVARLGGDEFTIVMSAIANAEDAAKLAKKVIDKIFEPISVEGQEIVTSASIGISIYPDDALDAETLIKAADTAMYHAKELGKNNFQFYTQALTDKVYEHLSIERGLRSALMNNELKLYYQPLVSLINNQIVGFEALIRWHHPEKGLISPDLFIGVAEESGLINEIGEWVLRNVCHQIQYWRQQGLPPVRVSVNLSGKQVLHEAAVHALEKILDSASVQPQEMPLDLEITESVLQTAEKSVANLTRLKAKGVRLAIDDFGTGYSSLAHIKHLPIDIIKIDRSFVRDIAKDPDDEAIAAAIIAMGHSLNLKVIGEGVENQSQLEFLREQGCDEAQGFIFSEPVPAEQVPQLFEREEMVI